MMKNILSGRFIEARTFRQMSQEQVADIMFISLDRYISFENCTETLVDIAMVIAFCRAVNVNVYLVLNDNFPINQHSIDIFDDASIPSLPGYPQSSNNDQALGYDHLYSRG